MVDVETPSYINDQPKEPDYSQGPPDPSTLPPIPDGVPDVETPSYINDQPKEPDYSQGPPDPSTLPPIPDGVPNTPAPEPDWAPDLPEVNILSTVPQYEWWGGCGPTAVGSILAHWDAQGYTNLFDADGFEALKETGNVKDQITSPEHAAKFARLNEDGSCAMLDGESDDADNPDLPDPLNSIADFFETSVDPLECGWSYASLADEAFIDYAAYKGYEFAAETKPFSDFSFEDLMSEIDAGKPVFAFVDSGAVLDGNYTPNVADSVPDHFVPIIGYNETAAGEESFSFFANWGEEESASSVAPWQGLNMEEAWGISEVTTVTPIAEPDVLIA